ncbi:MAG: enoyl-CoA hydratase [Halieaceae bacterium]|jgi:enoyl-CoA hydratase/carnithine racemase|nr:enoyl-CoA hydratase [Halieaceae bacterium]
MSTECVQTRVQGGITSIRLNRPAKKNALNAEAFYQIASALNEARENDHVNVVVLSGEGGNFCSGMDLSASFDEGSKSYDDCVKAVIEFDKPVIAAVNGIAIGGGATIPMHCDLVYVTPSLKMRLPFVNLGLVPEFASSYMLQANIGARRAAELMYTAKWIDAELAMEVGIATAIVPEKELMERALQAAEEIAQWPVGALKATKQCLKQAHTSNIQQALDIERTLMLQQAGSPENTEAIMAFMEKREPDFKKLLQS